MTGLNGWRSLSSIAAEHLNRLLKRAELRAFFKDQRNYFFSAIIFQQQEKTLCKND